MRNNMCVPTYNLGTRIVNYIRISGIVLFLSAIVILFWGCEADQKVKVPKNIIVMIADGCGYNQVDAANIYRFGKTGTGIYEKFPIVYGMSTYSADGERYNPDLAWKTFEYFKRKPTDSGASATAMSTGVKTYIGAIDWAGHGNQSGRVIEEKIDFDQTIEAVIDWVEKNSSWDETMLVITGDHETGYLNGPGSGDDSKLIEGGVNVVWTPLMNNDKGNLPGMEWHSGGHTNQLIPFYAKGAGSGEFHKYAVGNDVIKGKFLDNGDVGIVMMKLWHYSNRVTKRQRDKVTKR